MMSIDTVKKNISFLLLVIILCVGYAAFLFMDMNKDVNTNAPKISFDSDVIEVSVHDKEDKLLEGISARDDEDGNLSDKVIVQSISEFDSNKQRKVSYAVFDSDDNVTTATRTIKYTDYSQPEFDIVRPLISYYWISNDELLSAVKAHSCIDGDVSRNLQVTRKVEDNGVETVNYTVVDSTGTTANFSLKISTINEMQTYDIQLTNNLLNVPLGTPLDPRSYIASISNNGMDIPGLTWMVQIDTDYNPYVSGQYEFIYRLSRNGEFGATKLVVNVIG